MPLYTYIVSYKGASYIAQGRHSNFTGFVSTWATNIPESALPSLTPVLRKVLAQRAYSGTFTEVSNAKHVWRKTIEIGGDDMTVVAVQTDAK